MKALLAIAVLLLSTSPVFAQSQLDPDYIQGHQFWQAGDYPNASKTLSRYRLNKKFAQTYDVDYWIGTSWCRMPGEEKYGLDLLDWGYRFVQMPDSVLDQYRGERDLCKQFVTQLDRTRVKPRIIVASALASATARAEGKIYFIGGGDKGGLRAYPLRVKRPLKSEEYDRRLFPLSDHARAVEGVQKLVSAFRVAAHGRFVLASSSPSHTPDKLLLIAQRLDHYVSFLLSEYGLSLPDYFITVYLVPDPGNLRALADRVHGLDASLATLGYAFQNDLSVVGVLSGTAAGTLLHELFHLTVRSTYGAIPQWLDEGLASLYETSTVAGDRYYGEPNWRSKVVNELRYQFPHVTLQDVITTPWFSDEVQSPRPQPGERLRSPDEQAYILALSRYFVMFLQEQRLLGKVFQAYRYRKPPDEPVPAEVQAVRILEQAVGKGVREIDGEFHAWYQSRAANPVARLHLGKVEAKEIPREIPRELGPSVDREAAPGSPQ